MAFINNTAFQVKVTNVSRNGTQNIAGKFGSFSGNDFTAADCSAGQLVVPNSLIPSEGYEGIVDGSSNPKILNGNTWYMVNAANGLAGGRYGDHTGIYAFNNYDVNKVTSGDLQYNLGAKTLGVGLPAGNRGDFLELIVGEQYKFGAGNFASAPTVGQFCAISAGFFAASSASAPAAGSGVYVKVLRSEPFNEGTSFAGTGYIVQVLRTVEASA